MGKVRSIGIAEARPKLTQIVEEVNTGGEPFFIVSRSRVKAVLVGIDQYNDMVEQLEDLADSLAIMEAKLEGGTPIPFEEYLKKSKAEASSVQAGA
ncbi:MAG: type II toxin-antitoxin system Phd/YefM family antitoxin [Chloroflexi bacterium]|nr:type II toxin-antitoxin system Phd/YefM family antitoxin [Chloroflexota bacterium]